MQNPFDSQPGAAGQTVIPPSADGAEPAPAAAPAPVNNEVTIPTGSDIASVAAEITKSMDALAAPAAGSAPSTPQEVALSDTVSVVPAPTTEVPTSIAAETTTTPDMGWPTANYETTPPPSTITTAEAPTTTATETTTPPPLPSAITTIPPTQ